MKTAKIDLHLHLDGSLYLPWAYETAIKRGVVSSDYTFEEYYERYYQKNFKDRTESIKKFDFPVSILQTKEDISDAVYYLVRTLHEQEMIYAEIRFATQQHTQCGLTQKEAMLAAIDGMHRAEKDFPDVIIRLINCMMHKGEDAHANYEANLETIEVVRELMGQGVVGLDLAGYENNGDFLLYAPLFEKAREYHIPHTMHAGEMGIGKHVLDALEMKAHRIGHGVNAVQDESYLKAVVETQIPLEVCPSSNTKYDFNYVRHPVKELIRKGAKVTINSDNMVYAKTSVHHEHEMLRQLGITVDELKQCTLNAVDAAFCDEETKNIIRQKLQEEWK